MNCPKCGAENPDDARLCLNCNCSLTNISSIAKGPSFKTGTLSIAAIVLGILGASLALLAGRERFEIFLISVLIVVPALCIGIISLARIKASQGWPRGKRLAIAGVVIPAICLGIVLSTARMHVDRPWSTDIVQKSQFHSIDTALEMFNAEFEAYPSSDALDTTGQPYCGAMKLCEAIMGRDLKGFNPDSTFRSDGLDGPNGNDLYPEKDKPSPKGYALNIKNRHEPYLQLGNANAYMLKDIYGTGKTGPFSGDLFVLCDGYTRVTNLSPEGRRKIGMPVLYYKANTSKTAHDLTDPNNPENIYNYKDNHALVGLGVPWEPGKKHPLFTNPEIFYKMTRDKKASTKTKDVPHRPDSFILISAGKDGMYGTKDDIVNF